MQDVPIVRIEVERMKHSLLTALSAHATEINNMVQDAVDNYCTVENLQNIINNQAKVIINDQVKKQIEHFYMYGDGKLIIKEAVEKQLQQDIE